jgi:glutaredoxin
MNEKDSKTLSHLPADSIVGFTIYTRSTPYCAFCKHAKNLLILNFRGVPIKEIDISPGKGNEKQWETLLQKHPDVNSVPQVLIHYDLDSQEKTILVGGPDDITRMLRNRSAQ